MLGSNIATPTGASVKGYGGLIPSETKKTEVYESPVKQARMIGILHSDRMRETLSYRDNDVTYGLVTPKP
jgi:hypothetical protein